MIETAQPPSGSRHVHARDLTSASTMAEGFAAIVGDGSDHLMGTVAGVDAGDIEALHQMRVAIRQLRSAFVLFDHYLEPTGAERFAKALRGFGRILGPGRDWDVFVAETLPDAMENCGERAWLARLAEPAEGARRIAHSEARRLIASPEFTGFVPALTGWVDGGIWTPAGKDSLPAKSLAKHAPEMLERLADKVHRRGRHLTAHSLSELHALRKTLKKLRYGAEYLAGLYPGAPVKQYRHACKSILALLGRINDTVTADSLADALAADGKVHLAPAVSLLSKYTAERRKEAARKLPEAWAIFRDAEPFWR